jgi:enoyl-CoA hydratase/carnithine racemase
MSAVQIQQEGAVRILVNNNPAARNVITPDLCASLPAALIEAEADPEVGAIVLTGGLTGERISGEHLHAMGMVNRLTDQGAALNEAVTLAARLATAPARASEHIKHLCQHAYGADLETQIELEAQYMVVSQGDAEATEGIAAFLAKRPPDFLALRGKPESH